MARGNGYIWLWALVSLGCGNAASTANPALSAGTSAAPIGPNDGTAAKGSNAQAGSAAGALANSANAASSGSAGSAAQAHAGQTATSASAGQGGGGVRAGSAAATGGMGAAGQLASAGQASSAGASGSTSTSPTGTFPAITDPWQTGPFTVATMSGAGPSRNATVLYPRDLGKNGLKHPIVVWDNGAGQTGLSIYGSLLQHLASHGFAVYAANSATDDGKELTDGLDWMIAQNGMSGTTFYQKLDQTKTAAMGHSQGSIATFSIAGDPRLTTTIHLSGGTNPDIAKGHATLPNLHNPAAFLCGEEPGPGADGLAVGDTASPWCAYDFEHATVPVFLAQIQGASHITAPGMTLGACAAWLRWRLMDDSTMKTNFIGADCTLCKRPSWKCKSKDLM